MQPIIEYMQQNPSASTVEIIRHFEDVLEIPKQVYLLKNEVDETRRFKSQLRPLYAKRLDAEERMRYAVSDMEVEIFLEYPPRKGSEAQRETMRDNLKRESKDYNEYKGQFDEFTYEIKDIEDEIRYLEMGAKNARRLTELFAVYVDFVKEMTTR